MCMLKKPLKLSKEFTLWRDAINDSYRVIDVVGNRQVIAGIFDRTHMTRRDVSSGSNESEIFHTRSKQTRI